MSLLKSYSFGQFHGVSELPTEVLNLFIEAAEDPSIKLEYSSEIISNALRGKIDLQNQFNLRGYQMKITENGKHKLHEKSKKEVYLDFNSRGDEYEEVFRSGGITEDSLVQEASNTLSAIKDEYEKLLDNDELSYAIANIKGLQTDLFLEEKIDFIGAIKKALHSIPSAVQEVKAICDKYPKVAEYVYIILNSNSSVEELLN